MSVMLSACSSSTSPKSAPRTTTQPPPLCSLPASAGPEKSVAICDLAFAAGDALGVDLHPNATPIRLNASAPGFEVCPSPPESRILSGFHLMRACVTIDPARGATLPSTQTIAEHFGVIVRPHDRRAARLERVTITYTAVDRHFVVVPPNASTIVAFTPVTSPMLGASALGADGGFDHTGASVTCTQNGRTLAHAPVEHAQVEGDTFCGGVALGQPVTARLTGGVAMLLEWA
jgi:hypothetical protein